MMAWLYSALINTVRTGNTYLSLVILWGLPLTLLVLVFGLWHWVVLASADVFGYYFGAPDVTWWPERQSGGMRPLAEYVIPSLDTALSLLVFAFSASMVCVLMLTLRTRTSLLGSSMGRDLSRQRRRVDPGDPLAAHLSRLTRTLGMRRPPVLSVAPIKQPFACAVSNWMGGEVVLSVTLVRTLTPEQLLWVMAHEVGHLRYRDSYWRFVWLGSVQALGYSDRIFYWVTRFVSEASRGLFGRWLFITLYLAVLIYPLSAVRLGQRISVGFYRVVDAWVSRQCEYRADRFASTAVSAAAGVEVLRMLGGDGEPNWPKLFASHPPIQSRIKRLNRA